MSELLAGLTAGSEKAGSEKRRPKVVIIGDEVDETDEVDLSGGECGEEVDDILVGVVSGKSSWSWSCISWRKSSLENECTRAGTVTDRLGLPFVGSWPA